MPALEEAAPFVKGGWLKSSEDGYIIDLGGREPNKGGEGMVRSRKSGSHELRGEE